LLPRPVLLAPANQVHLKFLKDNQYQVITVRDLAKYVDPKVQPEDPFVIVRQRQQALLGQ
jgi:hypothetical protein